MFAGICLVISFRGLEKDDVFPQELDVEFFYVLVYPLKGRTVTPLLHKLFLGELHRYYSGYYLVRKPFE